MITFWLIFWKNHIYLSFLLFLCFKHYQWPILHFSIFYFLSFGIRSWTQSLVLTKQLLHCLAFELPEKVDQYTQFLGNQKLYYMSISSHMNTHTYIYIYIQIYMKKVFSTLNLVYIILPIVVMNLYYYIIYCIKVSIIAYLIKVWIFFWHLCISCYFPFVVFIARESSQEKEFRSKLCNLLWQRKTLCCA